MFTFKTKITDDFVGKYAVLKRGIASGLIGVIEKNTTGKGSSPYMHVTKTGIKTGVMFQEDVELVNNAKE